MSEHVTSNVFVRAGFCLAFIFLAFGRPPSVKSQQVIQETSILEPGAALERELGGGQEHRYQVALKENKYARLIVEQRGVDVVIRLEGIEGNLILLTDDEYRKNGEEIVEIVAKAARSYRLIVRASSKSAPTGRYAIRVAEIRDATENDRSLQEARTIEAKFRRALNAGEYEDARLSVERALAISEKVLGTEQPFVATLLMCLSDYYEDKQDPARTLALRERAVAIFEKALGDEHPRTVSASRSLAFAYSEANDVVKAERLVRRALEISEKTLGPDHYLFARCLHTLAVVRVDSKKLENLQRALKIAEETVGPDHIFVGNVLTTIGLFYLNKGDYRQAEPFLLRSKAAYEKTQGPGNVSSAVDLHNLGIIARQRKDYTKAEDYYRQAIAIVEKAFGPENPRLANILNNIANIYRAKGEYAKSLEAHHRVLRIWETNWGPYHPYTLLSLGNIAKTYAAQGSIAEAIKFQARVDAVIERNIEMNLAVGSERQKLYYLNSIAERTDRTISLNANLAPNDPSASALAALVLLQRKGRVLDAMSESFASLRRRSNSEEQSLIEQFNSTTAELARLVLNGPQKLSYEDHQKKVHELEEQKERLEADISRRSAEFRANSQAVTLGAVQAAIPANAALIEFAIYHPFDPKAESNSEAYKAPRYIAYVLRRNQEVAWHDLGDAKAIDEAIEAWRRALRDPKYDDVKQLGRLVDQKVMQPVRALIGEATQLLLSPDGSLNLIPFEALVDEKGRFLIERYSSSYLTTGRDLLRLAVERSGSGEFLVMAAPSFGDPEMASALKPDVTMSARTSPAGKRQSVTTGRDLSNVYFASLEGTAREARAIKMLFPEARVVTGGEATESLLKHVDRPRVVHLATHGFFLRDATNDEANEDANRGATRAISANVRVENPLLRSGLALSGANLNKGATDDGILTALEASGLNLWGTKLVTLSACDTGLGEVENGEGVYGFRRAFVLAGAETLVMSLWSVSDYVTREMMTAYYEDLKRGQGRGEALRQAKLNMLKRNDRRHPFYWASFIQAGEWANLEGKR